MFDSVQVSCNTCEIFYCTKHCLYHVKGSPLQNYLDFLDRLIKCFLVTGQVFDSTQSSQASKHSLSFDISYTFEIKYRKLGTDKLITLLHTL